MPSSPFHGAFLKLQRAALHREALEREIDEFFRHEPDRVVSHVNDQGQREPFLRGDPLPPRWSAIAGDCLQNLRSALEHVAWACARRHTGKPPSAVTFKITRTESHWIHYGTTGAGRDNEAALGDAWRALREVQPYNRGPVNPDEDPLWVLNELARIDRHLTLHLVVVRVEGSMAVFGPLEKVGNVVTGPDLWRGRLVVGPRIDDPTAGVTFDPPSPNVHSYYYMTFNVACDPDGDVAKGFPLIHTLAAIEQEIRASVMPAFQALNF
jgi:hypothetical protein